MGCWDVAGSVVVAMISTSFNLRPSSPLYYYAPMCLMILYNVPWPSGCVIRWSEILDIFNIIWLSEIAKNTRSSGLGSQDAKSRVSVLDRDAYGEYFAYPWNSTCFCPVPLHTPGNVCVVSTAECPLALQ